MSTKRRIKGVLYLVTGLCLLSFGLTGVLEIDQLVFFEKFSPDARDTDLLVLTIAVGFLLLIFGFLELIGVFDYLD